MTVRERLIEMRVRLDDFERRVDRRGPGTRFGVFVANVLTLGAIVAIVGMLIDAVLPP